MRYDLLKYSNSVSSQNRTKKGWYQMAKENLKDIVFPLGFDPLAPGNGYDNITHCHYFNVVKNRKLLYSHLKDLNNKSGVYIWLDDQGTPLLVGYSINLDRRIRREYLYKSKSKVNCVELLKDIMENKNLHLWIMYIPDMTPFELVRLEVYLIQNWKPLYNKMDYVGELQANFGDSMRKEWGRKTYVYDKEGFFLYVVESQEDFIFLFSAHRHSLKSYIDTGDAFRNQFFLYSKPVVEGATPLIIDRLEFQKLVKTKSHLYSMPAARKEQANFLKSVAQGMVVFAHNITTDVVTSYLSCRYASKVLKIGSKWIRNRLDDPDLNFRTPCSGKDGIYHFYKVLPKHLQNKIKK